VAFEREQVGKKMRGAQTLGEFSTYSPRNQPSGGISERALPRDGTTDASTPSVVESQRKSVAIVDDGESLCTMLAMFLEEAGYRVQYVAHDGAEIVSVIESKKSAIPDLILMDYRMPGMDGLEAARRISKLHSRINIVIITASEEVGEDARRSGFGFLRKPFSLTTLLDSVEKSLAD